MTNETAIVMHQSAGFIAPVVEVQSALVRFQAMKDFIDRGLMKGRDFDTIPGTPKPTLLKPGAEKLANFFGLAPRFEIVEKELDWLGTNHGGEPFFYFHYRCRLTKGEDLAAEGEGSANSFEKKYRWRNGERVCPKCGKPTIIAGKKEFGGGFICFAKKGGCGAKFSDNDQSIIGQQVGQVKNPDIADIVNTLQKMAQKRAYVAAVLLAVNGSEYFTQDVEDFNFIEGDYRIEVEQLAPAIEPAVVIREEPAPKNGKQATHPVITQTPAEFLAEVTELPMNRVVSTLKFCDLDTTELHPYEAWWGAYKAGRNASMTPQEAGTYANLLNGKTPDKEKAIAWMQSKIAPEPEPEPTA